MARKARWLAYCKIRLDVVEHPGTSGILHYTYYVLRHTKSFSGILTSKAVWVLERRVSVCTGKSTLCSRFQDSLPVIDPQIFNAPSLAAQNMFESQIFEMCTDIIPFG